MNSKLKKEYQDITASSFELDVLENEAEISALLHEVDVLLKPCAHCSNEHTRINYKFVPTYHAPHRASPGSTEIVMKWHPHTLYAECPRAHQNPVSVDKGCGIRTQEWHAEDDEADFREALRLIVEAWNRRPE